MAQRKFERLREAAALQRSLREAHGDEAEEVLAEHIAQTSSGGLAQATFDAAIARNRRAGVRFQLLGGGLPGKLLHPAERVYDIAVGAQRTDRFPLLLVTDRRVLHAIDRNLRGWTILEQAPAAEITGAEVKKGLISGRLQVHVRHGEGPSLRVNKLQRAEEVAALLRHLAAGGAPPR